MWIGCSCLQNCYILSSLGSYGQGKTLWHADSVGPAVLVAFIVALIGLFIYGYYLQFPYPHASVREEPGVCVKHNLGLGTNGAFSTLQLFEPSSIRIDLKKNLMLISSLDDIVAYSSDLPTDDAAINAPI